MTQRCNPRKVQKTYLEIGSWRKAARELNSLYNVNLSHTSWRDFAKGKSDIADPETRDRLGLGPRRCRLCGHKHTARKQAKPKRIRSYGYPVSGPRIFLEVLDLREAMR